VFTSLITQGIKVLLDDQKVEYSSNVIAAVVSVVLAVAIPIGLTLYSGGCFSLQLVIQIIVLAVLSWLCAMLGYDKVLQALAQIRKGERYEYFRVWKEID
jgi:hypothetical protein